jgi:photosystem II stability/assembly factor-like uncharacterized protein
MEVGQQRARRGLTTLVVAVLVVGVVYLRPSLGAPGQPAPAPAAVPTSGSVLASASFGDADHGVVELFSTGPNLPFAPQTYRTADGGRSWVLLPGSGGAPVLATYVNAHMIVAAAPGPAAEARISDDGGRTWRPLAHPLRGSAGLSWPSFLDEEDGWWLDRLGSPQPGAASQPVALWRTRDGGRTWQKLAGDGIPEAGSKGQPVFANPSQGVLPVMPAPGVTTILATEDGGDSWHAALTFSSPLADATIFGSGLFGHGGRLVLVPLVLSGARDVPGGVGIQPGTPISVHAYALVSDDGGRTWSPPREGPTVAGPAATSLVGAVLDAGGRLVLLDGRRLWTSDDAGATWVARVAQLPEGLVPAGSVIPAQGALFVIAERQSRPGALPFATGRMLLRSRDGGVDWEEVSLPRPRGH